MLPFRRILFPVDYSPSCRAVIPYVQDMAYHFHAQLAVIHAFALRPCMSIPNPREALVYTDLGGELPLPVEQARAQELQRLREFAATAFPGQHVDIFPEEGEAATAIDRTVQHQGTDLVMIPTRGCGPVRRFLLGSVTAKVLHDISAAAWTGAGSTWNGHRPAIPYQSILCAVDESPEAEAVLRAGAAIAESYGARLTVIHSVGTFPASPDVDLSPYRDELLRAAVGRLQEMKRQAAIDAPHFVIEGLIADVVREYALREKADLLITGRGHAQGGIGRIWSNLYAVVRDAPCPVLSI
jgi:nucleotide-binding universal stress UspA family protein